MMTLLSLPLELLQQIAACVQSAHPPSLHAFSLTSRVCHRASAFLLFKHINIAVHDQQGLQQDVKRIREVLFRTGSARHVQRISIQGALCLNTKKTDSTEQNTLWLKSSNTERIVFGEEPNVSLWRPYVVYDEPVIKMSSAEDMAWAPIVGLLELVPCLKDLVYNCQNQFPPSLLSAIHGQHPQCRLHHLTFRFRTLLWGNPYAYEMKLATSPSLHRLHVLCSGRDTDGDDDFNLEAAMQLAAGLAPNLKQVTILNISAYNSWKFHRTRDSWDGLPGLTARSIGSLTALSIWGHSWLAAPSLLQDWMKHTDFRFLQHLTLGGSHESKSCTLSGAIMEWVAQNLSFPRMRTLYVYLSRDDMFLERPQYSENAASFFQAFGPLEELSIHGPIDSHIMGTIWSNHGASLRKIVLRPWEDPSTASNTRRRTDIAMEFTKDSIMQIVDRCPLLEELAMPVKRSKSSAAEAELYRCFSEMKALRKLTLTLQCSNWHVYRDPAYNPHFEGDDALYVAHNPWVKKGDWKETFINCAVDEALASSIWKIISQNKKGRRLERLKLWTTGGGEFGGAWVTDSSTTITKVLDNLRGSWLIERVPRDDQDDVIVTRLGRHCAEIRGMEENHSPTTELVQIFRDIWPATEGSRGLHDDWSSFPLPL